MQSKLRCGNCGSVTTGPYYHSRRWHDVICDGCYEIMQYEMEDELEEFFGQHTYFRQSAVTAATEAAKAAMKAAWEVVEE